MKKSFFFKVRFLATSMCEFRFTHLHASCGLTKSFSLLLLFAMLVTPALADKVTKSEAQKIAEAFLAKKQNRRVKARFKQMPQSLLLSTSTSADYAPFYVYNAENNGGFVIVSGESSIGNIIGYSDTGSFDLKDAPSNVVTMMKMFSTLVNNVQRTGSTNYVPDDPLVGPKGNVKVAPLLDKIQWGQGKPFNGKMPAKKPTTDNKNTNYYVGCVATAMSQIMRFHKYPTVGKGTMTYTDNLGKKHSPNFGATTFDWTKMPERCEEDNADETENEQVSTLCSMAAYSVYMSFMPSGEAGAFSQAVTGALVHNFGYDNGISYKKREYYSTPQWMKMITDELDAGRPVFYSASNEDGKGGHAFVCDGYDDAGYVHINWGWSGKSNGYFHVNALNPYDLGIGANGGGYNLQQEIIIGIQKPQTPVGKKHWSIFGATRLSVIELNGEIMGMQGIVNEDCDAFTGKVALVLVDKNGKVVNVLKEEDKSFAAAKFGNKLITDGGMKTLWVSKYVNNVPNGTDYRIQFAVKATGDAEWTLIPSPNNLPNAAIATVQDNVITAISINEPKPNVELLKPITTSCDLHAKGSGKFTLVLKNNSNDFIINHIWLKFTDINDAKKSYYVHEDDTKNFHQVYDNSTKTINLLCTLPDEMPAGKYNVIAFEKYIQKPLKDNATEEEKKRYEEREKLWEGDYFKPAFTEANVLEVKEEVNTPIFSQEGDYLWFTKTSTEFNSVVKQGETIGLKQDACNYGAAGKAILVIKARNIENPAFAFELAKVSESEYAKLGTLKQIYGGKVNLNPGKYKLSSYFIVNGKEYPMYGTVKETIMEVVADESLALKCDEIKLPSEELEYGKAYKGVLKLTAKEEIKGATFTLRFKSAEGSKRTIAAMIFKAENFAAGETKEIPFEIKSYTLKENNLPKGAYTLYVDYKTKATQNNILSIGGNSSRIVYIGTTKAAAGIDEVANENSAQITICGKTLNIENANNIRRVEVFALAGAKVFSTTNIANTIQLPLQNGMYIIRIVTAKGIITKKVILQ